MPAPTPSWDLVPVHGTWKQQDGTLKPGKYEITVPARLTSAVDDTIIPAGVYATGVLNTTSGLPSLSISVPATDDPDIQSLAPWRLRIKVSFDGGTLAPETYDIDVPIASAGSGGVNLRTIVPNEGGAALATASVKFGVPNGVAIIDAQGRVLDGFGAPVTGGGGSGGAVSSVNGKVGAVNLAPSDIGAATSAQGAKADTAVQPAGLTKAAVGLANVDNTADSAKPVSTAQAAADAAVQAASLQKTSNLADLANPATARTNLGLGTAATSAATAFATSAQGAKADSAVQPSALSSYAPLASPAFTGSPTLNGAPLSGASGLSDLADTTASGATVAAGLSQRTIATTSGATITSPALGAATTPPARFAVRNGSTGNQTLNLPDSTGTAVSVTLLPGETLTLRQFGTVGWFAESGNKPLTALDARFAPIGPRTAVLVYSAGAYPARPSSTVTPAGWAKYIGPSQPTDWLSNDEWVNNS